MKILTLCTYPIKNPSHGGQIRVKNIVDAYRGHGHSVQVVGVLGSENYEREDGFLAFPGIAVLSRIIPNPFLMEDYALGKLCASDDAIYRHLSSLIIESPDVIHVEQPWLFAFAARYRAEHAPAAKLLYGSQNVEWRLKRQILSSYFGDESAERGAAMIEELELSTIKKADSIICVSESDAVWISSITGKQVVLAPNGVSAWKTTVDGLKEAAKIVNGYAYALYCASAHPPNMTGFFEIFGGGFGSLKPDEKMVVVGGVGWAIAGDKRVHQSPKLAEKVIVAGLVAQPCLEGLLDGAHCIVLPLTQGGGTNLKTAEALWSGKHVVATTVAMRGFEPFIGSSGVTVADHPSAFKKALRSAMSAPSLKISLSEMATRRAVLWDSCLNPLAGLLESIIIEVKR